MKYFKKVLEILKQILLPISKFILRYLKNILIALDQLANSILLGDPDETLSSRVGKRVDDCKICFLICKFLDIFEADHCEKSIERDEGKRQIFQL